ncbi:secreted protein [Colletotrichum chrysophilum]|uniref:Secreted protein n=1 Tax=Colletotrichum chrysophilum TaxID=1836956 RepID=A0AAD9AD40_9PEZI|nr:secreted protein [Colletotrichum chrysophilum]
MKLSSSLASLAVLCTNDAYVSAGCYTHGEKWANKGDAVYHTGRACRGYDGNKGASKDGSHPERQRISVISTPIRNGNFRSPISTKVLALTLTTMTVPMDSPGRSLAVRVAGSRTTPGGNSEPIQTLEGVKALAVVHSIYLKRTTSCGNMYQLSRMILNITKLVRLRIGLASIW